MLAIGHTLHDRGGRPRCVEGYSPIELVRFRVNKDRRGSGVGNLVTSSHATIWHGILSFNVVETWLPG